MLARRFVADGLWHCLCPQFTTKRLDSTVVRKRRLYDISRGTNVSKDTPTSRRPAVRAEDLCESSGAPRRRSTYRTSNVDRSLSTQLSLVQNLPLPALYDQSATFAKAGHVRSVEQLVRHLVTDRRENPNTRLYSALILVNIDPEEGSAVRVKALLEELLKEGITIDSGICHDVLQVTAVHLDHLLRNDILDYMRRRWFTLSPVGHRSVTAAMLREGQLEQASQRIQEMRDTGPENRGWLLEMEIYALLESGEIDQALTQVRSRAEHNETGISKSVWQHLLDIGSAAYHHAATSYVWSKRVNLGHLNPSAGVCLNALTVAAAAGDTDLAKDVFKVLGKRSTTFSAEYYVLLQEAYLNAPRPDLDAALNTLVMLVSAGIEAGPEQTRPLFQHFLSRPRDLSAAQNVLLDMKSQGQAFPIAALNVMIEAYVQADRFPAAFELYKSIDNYKPVRHEAGSRHLRPDLDTFRHLVRGAQSSKPIAIDEALYLAKELKTRNIKADSLLYEELLLTCLDAGYFDEASTIAQEMQARRMTLRKALSERLQNNIAKQGRQGSEGSKLKIASSESSSISGTDSIDS